MIHRNSSTATTQSTSSTESYGSTRSRKRPPVFPKRLYDMLENAERDGYAHIISWMPDGKSFKIHVDGSLDEEHEKALIQVLKQTFNQTRFKSFLRQLQLYGFERIYKGPRRGECKHGFLVRGRRDLLHKKSIEDFQTRARDKSSHSPKSVRRLFQASPTPVEVTSFMMKNDSRNNHRGFPSLLTPLCSEGSSCQYRNTSTIPTKLVNLVLPGDGSSIPRTKSCDQDFDDDELSMVITFPTMHKDLDSIDVVDDDDLLSIHGDEGNCADFTDGELDILRCILR